MTTLSEALLHGYGIERPFLCPVHGDNRPSASVNVVKKLWVCYTCGARGHVDSEAITVSLDAVIQVIASSTVEPTIYSEAWLNLFDAGPVHPYWLGRFSEEACRHFRLGYDVVRNAATYPMRDAAGRVLGVVRRPLETDGGPKYLYPYGISVGRYLFNYSPERAETVVLVEGAADAIALWEAGVTAFAVYGDRLSEDQIKLLHRVGVRRVLCAFDQDDAGDAAAYRVREAMTGTFVDRISWDRDLGKDVAELGLDQRKLLFEKERLPCLQSTVCESSDTILTLPKRSVPEPSATTSTPGRLRIVPRSS